MVNLLFAVATFFCLTFASLSMMHMYPKLSARHRDDDTNTVVRLVANIFVVMTSLVFGLLINSAKNTFESLDSSIHGYATDLIILDRTLRSYGLEAQETRVRLIEYVQHAVDHPTPDHNELSRPDSKALQYIDRIGDALAAIDPVDRYHEAMLVDARQQYHSLIQQRWRIVEHSEGNIPSFLIVMLIAWLTLIFTSFGYRAPNNSIVVAMFAASALLISASVYLVLDMNIPFHGLIQVSDTPLRRALGEMQL